MTLRALERSLELEDATYIVADAMTEAALAAFASETGEHMPAYHAVQLAHALDEFLERHATDIRRRLAEEHEPVGSWPEVGR